MREEWVLKNKAKRGGGGAFPRSRPCQREKKKNRSPTGRWNGAKQEPCDRRVPASPRIGVLGRTGAKTTTRPKGNRVTRKPKKKESR